MRVRMFFLVFVLSLVFTGSLFSQPVTGDSSSPGGAAMASATTEKVSKAGPIDDKFLDWDPEKRAKKAQQCFQKLFKAFKSNNPLSVKKLMSFKAQKSWGKDLSAWKKTGDLLKIANALKDKCYVNEWRGSYPMTSIEVNGRVIAVILKEEKGVYKLGLLYDCTDGFRGDFGEKM